MPQFKSPSEAPTFSIFYTIFSKVVALDWIRTPISCMQGGRPTTGLSHRYFQIEKSVISNMILELHTTGILNKQTLLPDEHH